MHLPVLASAQASTRKTNRHERPVITFNASICHASVPELVEKASGYAAAGDYEAAQALIGVCRLHMCILANSADTSL